jgi:hypothetical protein
VCVCQLLLVLCVRASHRIPDKSPIPTRFLTRQSNHLTQYPLTNSFASDTLSTTTHSFQLLSLPDLHQTHLPARLGSVSSCLASPPCLTLIFSHSPHFSSVLLRPSLSPTRVRTSPSSFSDLFLIHVSHLDLCCRGCRRLQQQ